MRSTRCSRGFCFQRQLAIDDQWLAADEARRVAEIASQESSIRGFVPIERRAARWRLILRAHCGEGRIVRIHEALLRSCYLTRR